MVAGVEGANGGSDWLACPQAVASIGRLDAVLRDAVSAEDSQLQQMAHYLVARSGKRLRPALLFLAATFGEYEEDALLRAAAALELIHVASLYHDDVMDRAPMRRGDASANMRWGNASATLAGTFLFARATTLMSSLGDMPNRLTGEASCNLCAGQLKEVENAYNQEMTDAAHLDILRRKTATLFELPCRLGALLANAPAPSADALARYGRHLGLAFQLADDALDLRGEAGRMGKATGADLREGVYSLAVLRALRREGEGGWLGERLRQARLNRAEEHEVLERVRESGCVQEALEVAREEAGRARAALEVLPPGAARLSLSRLTDFVVTRKIESARKN